MIKLPGNAAPAQDLPAKEWLLMAAAQTYEVKRDKQGWPIGTALEARKTFDQLLKSGDITKEQYDKAARDPRTFGSNR